MSPSLKSTPRLRVPLFPLFRMFDRNTRKEVTLEASREVAKPKTMLKPRKVKFDWSPDCRPGSVVMVSVTRCVLVERGKKMKSQLTVWTSIRRSFTLPGILRRTSSLWPPPTTCSCSRRTTNNIHISSFFTTPQFHTVLSGGETPRPRILTNLKLPVISVT